MFLIVCAVFIRFWAAFRFWLASNAEPSLFCFHVSVHHNSHCAFYARINQNVFSLAIGLKYLHERGIIHRDLKPHNLLLTERSSNAELKIADFGFARFVIDMMESFLGSPLYMAPEMIRRERYTSKSDLWSVGVIFYEMLTGRTPYHDAKSHLELAEMVMKQSIPFPTRVSPLCRDLLSGTHQKVSVDRIRGSFW